MVSEKSRTQLDSFQFSLFVSKKFAFRNKFSFLRIPNKLFRLLGVVTGNFLYPVVVVWLVWKVGECAIDNETILLHFHSAGNFREKYFTVRVMDKLSLSDNFFFISSHVGNRSDTSYWEMRREWNQLYRAHVSINIIRWIIQVLKKINKVLSLCFEFQYFPCHGLPMPFTYRRRQESATCWSDDWDVVFPFFPSSYQFAGNANLLLDSLIFFHSGKSRKSLF